MPTFNDIYPFTTENISGYMNGMNMTGKKVITVTASSDQLINIILSGATTITTFDINELNKYYMDLKLAGIKKLSFDKFLKVFLYRTKWSFDKKTILNLPITEETRCFLEECYAENDNSGLKLRDSTLFHLSYFSPEDTLWQNLYLTRKNYNLVKRKVSSTTIKFIHSDIRTLELDDEYDYMFLSNIADYISYLYEEEPLKNYLELMKKYLEHVKEIYIAYLYDVSQHKEENTIYDLKRVKEILPNIKIEVFDGVEKTGNVRGKDAVLILRR